MGILIAFIALILTVFLGLGFTGLTKRLTLLRRAGSDGPDTRVVMPTASTWDVMVLDRSGLLPWPSEVEDVTTHHQPLPWPSSLWPEPFVTRSEAELAQQRSDSHPQTRHTAPKHAPMQDTAPRHKRAPKQRQPPKEQPIQVESSVVDAPTGAGNQGASAPVSSQGINADMVRSWVGMYGLAGAVERYRKITGSEFSVAAREIAEMLRK